MQPSTKYAGQFKNYQLACIWEIVFENCAKQSTHQSQGPQRKCGRMLTTHLLTEWNTVGKTRYTMKSTEQQIQILGGENSDHNLQRLLNDRVKVSNAPQASVSTIFQLKCPLHSPIPIHLPSCWSSTTQHTLRAGPWVVVNAKFFFQHQCASLAHFCQAIVQKLPSLKSSRRPHPTSLSVSAIESQHHPANLGQLTHSSRVSFGIEVP